MKLIMKNFKMKNKKLGANSYLTNLLFMIVIGGLLYACDSDDVGGNFYTFTGDTVGSYIESDPENYSELIRLLDTTNVMGLLKGYGVYTVFIPDNEAMIRFYQSKGRESLGEFPSDTLKKIVYDHIIKGHEYLAEDFSEGFLPDITMSGRFVRMDYESTETGLRYIVNSSGIITEGDIEVHNGVVHKITEVLAPTENTIMEAIAADEKFSLFYEALLLTGLDEKLKLVKDESYVADPVLVEKHIGDNNGYAANWEQRIVPLERKYGYTVLMESDETFKSRYSITTIEQLEAKANELYGSNNPDDYKNSDNSLNRFIAYHLVNKKIPSKYFIEKYDNTGFKEGTSHSVQKYEMYEYIETMYKNNMMEVRTIRSSGEYNVFNMVESTGDAVRLTGNYDNDAINGVYHEIDGILAYSSDFVSELLTKRLRLDSSSFFPELANNNIRSSSSIEDIHFNYAFPQGYVDRINTTETTQLYYLSPDDRFMNFQGDEIWLQGVYDFEITTPVIPAGTYEVRFGYHVTGRRGKAQLYWDNQPAGIPLNLSLAGVSTDIGWVDPGTPNDDEEDLANDKAMRNRGYMKGGDSYKMLVDAGWGYGAPNTTGRNGTNGLNLRKILGIYDFTESSTHVLGVRATEWGEFMFDYLEFVPVEALELEGIE